MPFVGLAVGCSAAPATSEDLGEANEALQVHFSASEWSTLKTLSPVPDRLPIDTTNKYADSPRAARLGQQIFFEKRLSGPILVPSSLGNAGESNKVSCASCHMPSTRFLYDVRSDNGGPIPNATALGTGWFIRNVSTLVNTVFYVNGKGRSGKHWRGNEGFSDSEWFDAQAEPETNVIFNGSRLRLAHVIFDHYRSEYNQTFPEWPLTPALSNTNRFPSDGSPFSDVDNWNSMSAGDQDIVNRIFVNYGKAIEAYLRTLISRDAPFDRFMSGCNSAIGNSAKRGAKLFVGKAACVNCHNTPHFSDTDFHTIGMHVDTEVSPFADPNETGQSSAQARICSDPVQAIFNVNGVYSDDRHTGRLDGFCESTIPVGKWRTRSLRHVAATPPYMRTGQFATLDEVIEFYDRGGDPDGTFIGGAKEIHPLHLSLQEKKDLKAFLQTLTGDPPPAERLVDIHKP
ncbi:MAG TPA: cytochrome c peroxidase [Polyangiaceae bacterium]|nr:cytochrome c peroxidase [Polyangiaceae bacterium]